MLGKLLQIALLWVVVISHASCDRPTPLTDDEFRANAHEQDQLMVHIASVLDKIQDRDSAKAAKPELEKANQRLTELLVEVKTRTGNRSAQDLQTLLGIVSEEGSGALKKLVESYGRIMKAPELKEAIGQSFELQGFVPLR